MASFRILGPVEASDGERSLSVGGRTQLKLFAFLVLHANRAVSSDVLVDAVWGPSRSSGDNRLPVAVARLRKALEPLDGRGPRLRTVRGGYLLSVGPGELDADAFRERVREGREALVAGEPDRAAEVLESALGLWRGPALADVAFEEFAQGEIRHLEELRLAALEHHVDARLQLGLHGELVGELEAVLAEHPTRERVSAQLMLALYRCGRQGEALEIYQRTRDRLAEELGLEPGPALKAMERGILEQSPSLEPTRENGHEFAAAAPAPAARLPVAPTRLIGREQELEDVIGLLTGSEHRLVTLTGVGGVGKTRLALAAARAVEESFADGTVWVELAGATRHQDVTSTIARALSVMPAPGESTRDALVRYLAGKRLLLVIDNFEHVLEAAELVAELLRVSDGLTVLATSREALDLAAEHRALVLPLALPAVSDEVSVAEVESAAASALFLYAARRRASGFTLTYATAPVVARICARLDGLPLAMELAAGRTEFLGLDELAAGLASMTNLGTGPRDAPARQRTLAATIEWSYRLLDAEQKRAFARFGVFAGGATIDAAEAVTGARTETVEGLVAKNMLVRRLGAEGTTRLVMLETLREYALGELADDPEREAIHDRHHEAYRQLVEQAATRRLTRARAQAIADIDREIDNIIAALLWALQHAPDRALRLAGLLGDYWWIRGDTDGLDLLDAALGAAGEDAALLDRARAELMRSCQLELRRRGQAAHDAGARALRLFELAGDHDGISEASNWLGFLSASLGDLDGSRALAEAACHHARLAGNPALLARALPRLMGHLPTEERAPMLEQAVGLLTEAGDYEYLEGAYNNCGDRSLKEGRVEEALSLFELAYQAARKGSSPWGTMILVDNIGLANLLARDFARSCEFYELELAMVAAHGFHAHPTCCLGAIVKCCG